MAPIHLRQLRAKLIAIKVSGKSQLLQKDVAERLGISEGRISDWMRDGDMVPDGHLDNLCGILMSETPCELSPEQAKASWLGDLDAFKAVFSSVQQVGLDDVLQTCADRLNIQFQTLGEGLGLDEEAIDFGDEPISVKDRARFYLTADCDPTRRILVLSWYNSGWRALTPSPLHSGDVVVIQPTAFPAEGTLEFKANYGLRRYVFIEHDAGLVPDLRWNKSGEPLQPDMVSRFARNLALKAWAGKWRWGQVVLAPERDAPPSSDRSKRTKSRR